MLYTPAEKMRSQSLFLPTSRRSATVPLGNNPRDRLPFSSTYLSGPGKLGGCGECPQNSFRDAFRGVVHSPGYFVTGDSRTGRMMPWRFAQRWLTKLSLPDIEQACSGDDLPLGERLLWKRSAPPFKKMLGNLLLEGA